MSDEPTPIALALAARMSEQREEDISIQDEFSTRRNSDLEGFADNFPSLVGTMVQDPSFSMFDSDVSSKEYSLDIGIPIEDLEYDFFDAIRMSNQVPFVALNLDEVKLANMKAAYISTDRRFKIYHASDIKMPHQDLIESWSKDTKKKLSVPYTMYVKVLNPAKKDLKITEQSYINVVYKFGKGLFVTFKSDEDDADIKEVVSILRKHIVGFDIKLGPLISEKSAFVVDNIVIDNYLYRASLLVPWVRPDTQISHPLLPYAFLWPLEKDKPMSLRPRFILNFKLGKLNAKIIISQMTAKTNDVFFKNGVPMKFKEGTKYNVVKISGVVRAEDTDIVKLFIGSTLYLYGQKQQVTANTFTTRSNDAAIYLNTFMTSKRFEGRTFSESLRVTAGDIESYPKNITRLKAIDPSYWGEMATVKKISQTGRQPIPIVSTNDPDWQERLWNAIQLVQTDLPGPVRQIIRYPFEVSGSTDNPRAGVAPYFMVGSKKWPYIQLKENSTPESSGKKAFHPYVIACSTKQHLVLPGQTPLEQFNALADLSSPYKIQVIQKSTTKSKYVETTIKRLGERGEGNLPIDVNKVFTSIYASKSSQDIKFRRVGSPDDLDSLLHCLVIQSVHRKELKQAYLSQPTDSRTDFLKTTVRQAIADRMNWNLGRQEFFDREANGIKDEFLSSAQTDSRLYKTVLEKFFRMHITIISYSDAISVIEIPRHKFLYITPSYSKTDQAVVIFKHYNVKKNGDAKHHYEIVNMYAADVVVPWNIITMKNLFAEVNKTLAIGFNNIYRLREKAYDSGISINVNNESKLMLTDIISSNSIEYQYIDGAGKTRLISVKFKNSSLCISCEPMAPIEVDSLDDSRLLQTPGFNPSRYLERNNFEDALEFIKLLKIDPKDLSYRLAAGQGFDSNLVEGIWFKYRKVQFYMAAEFGNPPTETFSINNSPYYEIEPEKIVFKQHDQYEKIMNIMIQLARNLFIYAKTDDIQKFMDNMVEIIPSHVYDITGARRRITALGEQSTRTLGGSLQNYSKVYPSFFTPVTSTSKWPKLIVDSKKTWKGLYQHFQSVKTLRQNIIGASGVLVGDQISKIDVDQIVRYPEFFNRPDYIEEFYAYASDFTVRGPDQLIFMSEADIVNYIQYLPMESSSPVLRFPIPTTYQLDKIPMYFVSTSGDLYILQNVEGSSKTKAMSVIQTWKTDRINLGFYAEDIEIDNAGRVKEMRVEELDKLVSSDVFILVRYDVHRYAALIKLVN